MFYSNFCNLCVSRGVTRTKACIDCGVSRTAWNKWKDGAIPNGTTLNRFADYFGVPVDSLINENPPSVQWNSDNDPVTNALIQEVLTASEEDKRKMLEIIRVIKGASY